MRPFQKFCVLIFISVYLQVALITSTFGQNYLNIDSFGEHISIGIEENQFAFFNLRFKDTWSLSGKTSLYTEALLSQLFIASVQKEFILNDFVILPKLILGGKYSDGFHFAGVASEFYYSREDLFSVGVSPILTYYSKNINFRFQAGAYLNVFNGQIDWYIKYGPPVYIMNRVNNFTTGLFFKEKRLKIHAGLQVPDDFEFKYSRVVISFIYSFNYAVTPAEER